MANEKEYFDLMELTDSEQEGDEEEDVLVEMWDLTSPPEYEWFHGCLDRKTAEERLLKAGRSGSFLVRESERKPGNYCISFLSHNAINHFRITAVCGDYYIGGRQFQSINDLVGYYMKVSSLLQDEQLQFPVAPPEPIEGRRRVAARYPYEKTPDTDELSFSQGDIFLVEADINDDWLWGRSMRNRQESGLIPVALVQQIEGHLDAYEGRDWFNSRIAKDEAHDLLMDSPVGSFIVRPSDSTPGDYSLSVRVSQSVSRFRIQRQKHQYIMGGRLFDSLDAIVDRYKKEHIAENLSLTEPAKRRVGSLQRGMALGESDHNAYAAFRLRARPGHVIVKRIDTSKKDWLFKKGSKSNRWKPMLFTLNHSDQHLFMHENEKRAKPKGFIDLGYATIMPVHPSLFGKPHCFQVMVRAFNETQFHYLCADTEESKREWTTALSRCSGPKTSGRGSTREGHTSVQDERYRVRQLRSIQMTVVEARRLQKHCHPFCRIVLDDMKVARTQTKVPNRETVKDSCEVIWDEEFKFEDLPVGLTTVSVAIYTKNKRLKDTHIGSVDIPLYSLPNLAEKDEWYPLGGAKGQGKSGPSIRIKVKFTHEVIMSVSSYDPLKELLLSSDLLALKALESVCKDSVRRELAATLVRIFRRENQAIQLLRTVASQEVEREGELGTMFRGNTLATLLMDQFMGMVAVPYRQATLRDAVQYAIQLDQPCELDPSLLSQHAPSASENLERLITVLERVLKAVYKSLDNCPVALRYLFACLQKAATDKWPEKPEARTRIVSAFLFLRLLGPALLKPKMFNLTSEQPSDIANRTLKLTTKSLQSLANLSSFTGLKEPYMAQINPFIERNQEKMVAFINELSSIPHCPVTDDDVSSIDLARELATVHHLCVAHHEQLDKLSQEQPHVKRLTAVALMLTKEEESLTASGDS